MKAPRYYRHTLTPEQRHALDTWCARITMAAVAQQAGLARSGLIDVRAKNSVTPLQLRALERYLSPPPADLPRRLPQQRVAPPAPSAARLRGAEIAARVRRGEIQRVWEHKVGKIVEALQAAGEPQSAQDLCTRLGIDNPQALSLTLTNLLRTGKVRHYPRVGNAQGGLWELVGAPTEAEELQVDGRTVRVEWTRRRTFGGTERIEARAEVAGAPPFTRAIRADQPRDLALDAIRRHFARRAA